MRDVPTQRVGPLAQLPELLAKLGVPLEDALAGTGIGADQLVPEARASLPALIAVLEQSATLARCGDLGLRLGTRQDLAFLGVMGEMMRRAPTLGDALRDYVGLQVGYSRGAVVYLQRIGDDFAFGYGVYQTAEPFGRQVYDLVIALGCTIVRELTGGQAKPLRLLQCCAPPEAPARYAAMLKAPVLFDQEQTCIVVSAADMRRPLPGADVAARDRIRDAIEKMVDGELADAAARARHILRPSLMIGEASHARVARALGLGPRTLTRRLAAAGTSFEEIKDEVRYNVARELLALTRQPVGQIAAALDYATSSAFNHAFRRWAGVSPSQWRARELSSRASVGGEDKPPPGSTQHPS